MGHTVHNAHNLKFNKSVQNAVF